MKHLRKHIKLIAAFLVVNFLSSMFAPNIAYALTSGPSAPEYTSFEPVDTTDMINMATGDFTYNLPILEVPGPAGGYPLSLSYHAGILPSEEASWVGLGWTLNPGAITRSLNGYADDYANAEVKVNDYWSGGTRKDYQYAIPIVGTPFAYDFQWSNDTYRGFNPEGVALVAGGPGYVARFGSDGKLYGKWGLVNQKELNIDVRARKASYKQKFKVDFNGIAQLAMSEGTPMPKGMRSTISTGLSIYSKANRISSTVSSIQGSSNTIHNNNGNTISTKTKGINSPFNAGLSFNRTDYWIDQDDISYASGVFNADQVDKDPVTGATIAKNTIVETKTFDRALLGNPLLTDAELDSDYYYEGLGSSRDLSTGPSVLAKDGYQLLGQGIGGMIEPYSMENLSLFEKKIEDRKHQYNSSHKNVDIENKVYNVSSGSLPFRFRGDFSNSFTVNPNGSTEFGTGAVSTDEFEYTYTTGKNYTAGVEDPNGVDLVANKVAGSKHIKTYTTSDLNTYSNRSDLALDYSGSITTTHDSVSSYNVAKQIGAFRVTKEDGATYHYAKALYSYDYVNRSFDKTQGTSIRTVENKQPYAYVWLLTGITGPDYVDRGGGTNKSNPNGILDENDWGYWVGFSYGHSGNSNDYSWRFPFSGYDGDLQGSHSYSSGKRQNAYLKAIYTKSHSALFISSERSDAQGAHVDGGIDHGSELRYRLSDILLVDNEYINTASNIAESIQNLSVGSGISGQDVMTAADISSFNLNNGIDLFQKHLRRVNLSHDYSLVPSTENSTNSQMQGKLSLKQVEFLAKGAQSSIIPPVTFNYELDEPLKSASLDKKAISLLNGGGAENKIIVEANALEVGDLLQVTKDGIDSYFVVKFQVDATSYGIDAIYNSLGSGIDEVIGVSYKKTKNPPHLKDHYDSWGYFKSDYQNENDDHQNMDFYRQTTAISAKSTDVWSLRKVTSPLGGAVSIEYEPDDFSSDGIDSKRVVNFKPGYKVKFQKPNNDIVWVGADNLWSDNDEYKFSEEVYWGVKNGTYSLVQPIEVKFEVREQNGTVLLDDAFDVGDNMEIQFNGIKQNNSENFSGPFKMTFTVKGIENDLTVSPVSGEFNTYLTELLAKTAFSPTHKLINLFAYTAFDIPLTYGGGLRVKALNILDQAGEKIKSSNYTYSNGVTPYTPLFDKQLYLPAFDEIADYTTGFHYENWNKYENTYQKLFNKNARIVDILPGPTVIYGNVVSSSENFGNPSPTYEELEFITYDPLMTSFSQFGGSSYSSSGNEPIAQARVNYILKDKSSSIGNLKKMSVKRTDTDEALYVTENSYANADELPNPQGIYEEMTHEHRRIHDGEFVNNTNSYVHQAVTTRISHVPSVMTKSTKIDYKLGTTSVSQNLAFDFYSGAVTESYQEDIYGNKYVNKSVPAYKFYDEMGLMFDEETNKNMLTQAGASYSYRVNDTFDPNGYPATDYTPQGLVAASLQTWSENVEVIDGNTLIANQSGDNVYRRSSNYNFIGDGTTANDDGTFKPASFSEIPEGTAPAFSTAEWERQATPTRYNVYSQLLEAADINWNYTASKTDLQNEKVFASVANARYDEFAYSGLEETPVNDFVGGGVILGTQATISSSTAHTGANSVEVGANDIGLIYSALTEDDRTYRASVWSTSTNVQASYYNEGPLIEEAMEVVGQAGGWYLLQKDIMPASGTTGIYFTLKANATLNLDDFRFQPVEAAVTSYVYNEWDELTDVLDANNLYTHYEYTAEGRLQSITRETLDYGPKLISESEIHYASAASTTFYGSIGHTSTTNKLTLDVNFSPPGSGAYQYDWTIDGVTNTVSTDTYAYTVNSTNDGWKDVIVKVTDSNTGASFSNYEKVYARYCPPNGTPLGSPAICELNSEGCKTGYTITYNHDGNCGLTEVKVYNPTLCQNSGDQACSEL